MHFNFAVNVQNNYVAYTKLAHLGFASNQPAYIKFYNNN